MRARSLLSAATAAVAGTAVGLAWAASRPRPPVADDAPPEPPPLPPGRTVAVAGRGELFVREVAGPKQPGAPTILLLHGWMFPADLNWFTCYDRLAEIGRVIALDHRGHGRGLRTSTPFRFADAADDAAALLAELGTGPVVAVGYSMGGPIAQVLWQRHPELVRGLVLCATGATFSDTPRARWLWRGLGIMQLALRIVPRPWWERVVHLQMTGQLPFQVTRLIRPDTPEAVKALLPWIFGELDRGSAEDIAEAGRELGRYDARGWISGIDVPTSVLITCRDRIVPARRQRDLAARIPDARAVELPVDHDGVVASADVFVPALCEAVRAVAELPDETLPRVGGVE